MLTSNSRDNWLPQSTENCLNYIMQNGNPIESTFYRNMNIDVLKKHLFTASSSNSSKSWNTHLEDEHDLLFDEGKVNDAHGRLSRRWHSNASAIHPYKKYVKFSKTTLNQKVLRSHCILLQCGTIGGVYHSGNALAYSSRDRAVKIAPRDARTPYTLSMYRVPTNR